MKKTQHIRTHILVQVDKRKKLQAFLIQKGHNKHIALINTYFPLEHSLGILAKYTGRMQAIPFQILFWGETNAKRTDRYTQDITQLNQLYILNTKTQILQQANFNLTSPDITFSTPT